MLRYAFFDDFKGRDRLLLWGDQGDMRALTDFLRQFAESPKEVRFDQLGFYAVAGEIVTVVPRAKSGGHLKRVSPGNKAFRWELDQTASERFADLVDPLTTRPGHQYLEPWMVVAGEPTVMVSCGEYPEDLRP